MLQFSVIIILLIQLTVAIVVKRNQYSNEEPTTFPTELFKPMEPNAEQSGSKTVLTAPQENNNYENFRPSLNPDESGNFKKYTVVTTYSSDDNVNRPNQMQQLMPVYTNTRLQSLNKPYPLLTHSWDSNPITSFEPDSGTGYFQVSSSNSYYNSDTMSEPVTRHFTFNSRDGDVFRQNGFFSL